MQVIVLQPPSEPDPSTGSVYLPCSEAMMLAASLQTRSRHILRIIDARLLHQPELEVTEALRQSSPPRIILLHTTPETLPASLRMARQCKTDFPEMRLGMFGRFTSTWPSLAMEIPWLDFFLCGDPEPILKSYLDYYDLPRRCERIPGLWLRGFPEPAPHWLPSLAEQGLDGWPGIHWLGATRHLEDTPREIEMCLSRGNSGLPPDAAFPGMDQPLRTIPLREAARLFERCLRYGVSRVHLNDPPSFWTMERMSEWCETLATQRNSISWSIQLLPMMLPASMIHELAPAGCGMIRFLIPDASPEGLRSLGCVIRPRHFRHVLRSLEKNGITARIEYWLGGPNSHPAHDHFIQTSRKSLLYPDSICLPYPLRPDAPAWNQHAGDGEKLVRTWMNPDAPSPTLERAQLLSPRIELIETRARRSVIPVIRRFTRSLREGDWIRRLEMRSLGYTPHS